MGQLYILKLQKKKWYVGYTDRGIVRVLEQLQNEGRYKAAKWTQKYRPVNWENAVEWVSSKGKTLQDEDEKTLEMMSEYGVRNVRGGQWCKVRMTRREIANLEKRAAKAKPVKVRVVTCGRCGRTGHNKLQCYARTTVDGKKINPKKVSVKESVKDPARIRERKKKITAGDIADSSSILIKRGVFCEDESMDLNVKQMWRIFKIYSKNPELTDEKWHKEMERWHAMTRKPLISLYPPDHWFHDSQYYDEKLSKEFERDGYLWTSGGAAVNPKIRKKQILDADKKRREQIAAREEMRLEKEKAREERRLEKEKARELAVIAEEERKRRVEEESKQELIRREKEKEKQEKFRMDCIKKLKNRGVMIDHSMATSMASFSRGLKKNSQQDEISSKWMDYFSTVSKSIDLGPLYPPDHWLHDNEKFNSSLSNEFEHDGFGWTESGFASKMHKKVDNSREPTTLDSLSIESVEMIIDSVTKEIEKTGKTVKKEARKLREEIRKKTGL